MEDHDRDRSDAVNELKQVTEKLEGQLENFKIIGPGVSGSVNEGGFIIDTAQ